MPRKPIARKIEKGPRPTRHDVNGTDRGLLFDVLETLPVMVCLRTPDYQVAFANRAFRKKFGESNGRRCYQYCCGYDKPCSFCESFVPLKTGQPHHWEFTSPDGSAIIDAYDFPFTDSDGSPLILEMDIDITERRQAEAEWRENEAMVKAVLNATPDAIYLKDQLGRLILANPATLAIIGKPAEVCIGKTDAEFYDNPAEGLAIMENDRRIMKSGKAEVVEEVATNPAGTRIYLSSKAPYCNTKGQVIGLVGTARDITERKRTEEALSESRNRFKILTDNIISAVALIDEHGRFSIVNPAFLQLFDLPNESSIKSVNDRDWSQWQVFNELGELLHVDEHPVRRAARTGRAVRNELVAVKSPMKEDLKWMLVSAEPLFGSDNQMGVMICTYNDITDHKRAEGIIAQQAKMLRLSFDAIIVWRHEGGIEFWNQGAEDLYGFTADEAIGRTTHKLLQTIFPIPWLEIENILHSSGNWQGELRHRTKNGQEVIVLARHQVIHGSDGIRRILETNRDITSRKQMEEAQKAAEVVAISEREFRLLAEAIPQIVWTTQPDGWNTYFNHQWVEYTGLSLEESCGHGWNIPFHPEDKQRAWDAWQNAVTNLASYSLECRLRRADGAYRWWLIRGVPVFDGNGEAVKWFGTCTDIEDLKLAEEALRQANGDLERRAAQLRALAGELTLAEQRERSRLANLLHDHLQQILVAAKFRLALLGRGGDDLVKQAAKEVEELLDESISTSRSLTAELSPPILHEAGLNEGLQWLARRMADTQGLFVNLELNECGPLPEDLRILLFQSVRELLFNIVKHAQVRSAVVNLRQLGGLLQVTVSDQGTGFDPDMLLPGEGSRGFGLLSIQERLQYVGGKLEIQSEPGRGSRFVLCVPITAQGANEPGPQSRSVVSSSRPTTPQYPEAVHKIRVMLADDHAVVRQGIANLLADEPDIEVVAQAADGQEAVELAARFLPDVILMDVSMPKLSGVEATRAIRHQLPDVRIIGLSMFEDIERAQAMRDAGTVNYLTKSGQAEVLIDAIRKSIQSPSKAHLAKSAD